MITIKYLLKDVSANDVEQVITEILGGTDVPVGDGRMQKTLPFAHPVYPWAYAESVADIEPVGSDWTITVKFTPRPYLVIPESH